jgi:ABC-2 type transport system permease protein
LASARRTTGSSGTLSVLAALGRVLAAGAFTAANMAAVAAVGLFFSTLTSSPLGAAGGAFLLVGLSDFLDETPQFAAIRGGLLTHHWLAIGNFVGVDASSSGRVGVLPGLLVQSAYIAIFLSGAILAFRRRDVMG